MASLQDIEAYIEDRKQVSRHWLELRTVEERCYWMNHMDWTNGIDKLKSIVARWKIKMPEKWETQAALREVVQLDVVRRKYRAFAESILKDVQSDEPYESKTSFPRMMEALYELCVAEQTAYERTEELLDYQHTKAQEELAREVFRATAEKEALLAAQTHGLSTDDDL